MPNPVENPAAYDLRAQGREPKSGAVDKLVSYIEHRWGATVWKIRRWKGEC